MSSKKKKSNPLSDILIFLTIFLIIFSMVILAPGIIIASLFNVFFQLKIGSLWAVTIIATLVILVILYAKVGEQANAAYLTLAIILFMIGCVITLYNDNNLFYNTVKVMYPILFR